MCLYYFHKYDRFLNEKNISMSRSIVIVGDFSPQETKIKINNYKNCMDFLKIPLKKKRKI